jgi:hypothetical protein
MIMRAAGRVGEDRGMTSDRRTLSPWWAMVSGMRAYGVAITVVWTMCSCTVLAVLAVAVTGLWLHVALSAVAVVELGLCVLTLRFLTRASIRGRFDV